MVKNFDLSKLSKIDIEALNKNVSTSASKDDAISVLFSLFDKNKDNKLDKEELNTIYTQIKSFDKNQNSIFEQQEAENFIESTKQNPAITNELKEKLFNIKAENLVKFLNEVTYHKPKTNNKPFVLTNEEREKRLADKKYLIAATSRFSQKLSANGTISDAHRAQRKNYFQKFNEVYDNLDKLDDKEYAAQFKILSNGISLADYRQNTQQFAQNEIDPTNISNLVAAKKLKQDKSEAHKQALKMFGDRLIKNLQNRPDYGAIKQGLNDTFVDWFGTSTHDIDEKSNELCVGFVMLSRNQNDAAVFCAKWQELTGVTFDVNNIQNAKNAKKHFESIQAAKFLHDTISDKRLKNVIDAYTKNPEIVKGKVSDDFFKPNYDTTGLVVAP